MRRRDLLGPWGEALACEYLRGRGCRIVACNYRSRFGEIDVIAEDRKFLIFAEVKLRKSAEYGAAREFVDARKQQRLRQTALHWLDGHDTRLQPRFDVIEIYGDADTPRRQRRINQIENAFE